MMEYDLLLFDRIEIIKTLNAKYDLENNSYIYFSGGKDSTVLHYLIDLALPNNQIPRVYINTGIEYLDVVKFVKELAKNDKRIQIINNKKHIKQTLDRVGYPFKSKQHSHNVATYKVKGDNSLTYKKYLGIIGSKPAKFRCPKSLEYQFTKDFTLNISNQCCLEFKKKQFKEYEHKSKRYITLTGMRQSEGGQRNNLNCIITKGDKLSKFHPLAKVDDEWVETFIEEQDIKLCKLYYPPYNFKRTGCKGCPFSLTLQDDLDTMRDLLPSEKKQCEYIWKPIYDEYRRIGYRLRKENNLFDV